MFPYISTISPSVPSSPAAPASAAAAVVIRDVTEERIGCASVLCRDHQPADATITRATWLFLVGSCSLLSGCDEAGLPKL